MGSTSLNFTEFFNIIDGELVGASETRRAVNPSTLEELPPVPVSTQADVDKAVAAAVRAQHAWADTPWAERSAKVIALADAMEANKAEFAKMLTNEQGKPLAFAQDEMEAGALWLRTIASFPEPKDIISQEPELSVETRYTPLGVAVGIVPWNFPVQLACGKIASALVTGNAFILKPSPYTPYCNLKMVELGRAIFPPGVFQALGGNDDVGPMLTAHPNVDKVSFTGSTATGRRVMAACAKNLTRVTLELGGNDPAIVTADVDPQVVGPKLALWALANSGQICVAIKRIYVHEAVYDAVLAAMVAFVKTLKVGDGHAEGVMLGPVNNKMQFDVITDLLADIEKNQQTLAHGSTRTDASKGFFIQPTIVDNPPDSARIVVEEPFGPVFPVLKWSDEADVVRRANDTAMGLGGSVWCRNTDDAARIANKLKAGSVWINNHVAPRPDAPFGGHKHSGIGSEWGREGLKSYCNLQTVHKYTSVPA